jgi:hypothetical protein
MGQELTQVLCPECGASGESDPWQSRWQCTNCGNAFFLRRCSECARVSYVDGLQGFRMPWPCRWCGQYNNGFSQNGDPAAASAAELAAETDRYRSAGGRLTGPGANAQDCAHAEQMTTEADPGDSDALFPLSGPIPAMPLPARSAVRRITLYSSQVTGRPRLGRRAVRRIAISATVAAWCGIGVFALLTAGGPRAMGMAAEDPGQGAATRVVQVAGHVGSVRLQGVPGQLAVVGTGSGEVTLTGQVHGTHRAPAVVTRLDQAADVLVVTIECTSASTCTQNLRLAVPAGTSAVVQQSGGQIVVTGVAGPLRITGAHVNISASGLRSPSLTAVITAGHLNAAFSVPPRQVSITLASAQAALRLPGSVSYRVSRRVMSGYIHAAIPQDSSAPRTVNVQLQSSELELLPV